MRIEADRVPLPFGSRLRRDSVVGAVYIVMFAVSTEHQGQGIGTALFADALRTVRHVAEDTGVWAVVLDVLNERVERFYRRFGFDTLVGGTRRLHLPTSDIP
jgi:GNAT superfamily N-acetyltransferase